MPTSSAPPSEPCPTCGRDLVWLTTTDIRERLKLPKPQAPFLIQKWQNAQRHPLPYVQLRQRGTNRRVVRSDWFEEWMNLRAHASGSFASVASLLRVVAPRVWSNLTALTDVAREHDLDYYDLDPMSEETEEFMLALVLKGVSGAALARLRDDEEFGESKWQEFTSAAFRRYQGGMTGV